MGDSVDITAVKFENKKVYLQEGLSEAWVIVQAFPMERVAAFIMDLSGKIADIVGGMDPNKSEGTRTAEMSSEDYKLISESETEVSLREGSFGKLIRVKNENIFREPSKGDVFEEEGFETEQTDNEEEFVSVLREKCPSKGKRPLYREKEASGTCLSNSSDTLCEKAAKKSELRVCTEKRASNTVDMNKSQEGSGQHVGMHIYETFFFNRKRRVARNWKLERAVRLAETGITGPRLRDIRIKKTQASAEKRNVHAVEVTESPAIIREHERALPSEEPVQVVKNVIKQGVVQERTFSAECADRSHNDAVQGDMGGSLCIAREQSHSTSEPLRKPDPTIMYERSSCLEKSTDSDTEGDIYSFDAVTISVPRLFSVFDVLFERESFSDELDV